jgi:hypothetical protein
MKDEEIPKEMSPNLKAMPLAIGIKGMVISSGAVGTVLIEVMAKMDSFAS